MAEKKNTSNHAQDFDVSFAVSEADKDTVIVTSEAEFDKVMDRFYKSDMLAAVRKMHDNNGHAVASYNPDAELYSVFPNKTESASEIDTDIIDTYAETANTDLSTVIAIASLIRKYSNKDCLVSVAYDAVRKSCNTDYKNVFTAYDAEKNRNKAKRVEDAKQICEDFDRQIDMKNLIREAISGTWMEGNYIMLLRDDGADNYAVDFLPLGIAEISDYKVNGHPVVLVNISKLKNALQKTMKRNSKRKALFFEKTEEEVKNNYPKEVYDAFVANDTYARIPVDICQVIRLNNKGFRYGCPPAFAAMEHILQIEQYTKSDRLTAKSRMKKIVWQKLSADLMGPEKNRDGYKQMAYAHSNLLRSWGAGNNVLVTTPPYVEKLEVVTADNDLTNTNNLKWEMQLACMPLGIYFYNLDGAQGSTGINMSLKQMYFTIDSIAEQFCEAMKVFHRYVLRKNGISEEEFVPNMIIGKADLMGTDAKRSLSAYMYNTLGASRETCYELIGYDVDDEAKRRMKENDENYDAIFAPRVTNYTNPASNSNSGGGYGRMMPQLDTDGANNTSGNVRNTNGDNGESGNNTSKTNGSSNGGGGKNSTTGNESNENIGRSRTNEDQDKQAYDQQRYQDIKNTR